MTELSLFLRICICIFLCLAGFMNHTKAQEKNAYLSWNDYRKANGRLLRDSLILKKRTIGEIMAYKGNDYEFFNIDRSININDWFAIRYQGIDYIQGKALNTGKDFAKVVFRARQYMVVYAAITEQKRDDFEELDLLYQISERFSRELEAELNKNRYYYLISLKKKKVKLIELNPDNMRKLLKSQESFYEEYSKVPNRNDPERIIHYISKIDRVD